MSARRTLERTLALATFDVATMQAQMDQMILETADFLRRMTAYRPETRPATRINYKGVA